MIVCTTCRKQMQCSCTGKRVVFGEDHVYAGDEFHCKLCDARVVVTNPHPYNDPDVRKTYKPSMIVSMKGPR